MVVPAEGTSGLPLPPRRSPNAAARSRHIQNPRSSLVESFNRPGGNLTGVAAWPTTGCRSQRSPQRRRMTARGPIPSVLLRQRVTGFGATGHPIGPGQGGLPPIRDLCAAVSLPAVAAVLVVIGTLLLSMCVRHCSLLLTGSCPWQRATRSARTRRISSRTAPKAALGQLRAYRRSAVLYSEKIASLRSR